MDKIAPMLAISAKPFSDADWLFEVKWDGTRALCTVDDHTRFINRRGADITYRYPELDMKNNVTNPCMLDGEITILKEGTPSFSALQRREHQDNPFKIKLLSRELPAVYVVFDILSLAGRDLTGLPLIKRKAYLEKTVSESPRVIFCPYVQEHGKDYFEAAVKAGFEGVMAKRKDSLYYPGKRRDVWLKIKKTSTIDCVIGGFTEGEGAREESFGALLLGVGRPLTFIGKVGTGFTEKTLEDLYTLLKAIETEENPFTESIPYRAHFVKPVYVCEVKYQELSLDRKLRAPVFLRLRPDKNPAECTEDI